MRSLVMFLKGDLCINTLEQFGNLVVFPVYINCELFFTCLSVSRWGPLHLPYSALYIYECLLQHSKIISMLMKYKFFVDGGFRYADDLFFNVHIFH